MGNKQACCQGVGEETHEGIVAENPGTGSRPLPAPWTEVQEQKSAPPKKQGVERDVDARDENQGPDLPKAVVEVATAAEHEESRPALQTIAEVASPANGNTDPEPFYYTVTLARSAAMEKLGLNIRRKGSNQTTTLFVLDVCEGLVQEWNEGHGAEGQRQLQVAKEDRVVAVNDVMVHENVLEVKKLLGSGTDLRLKMARYPNNAC